MENAVELVSGACTPHRERVTSFAVGRDFAKTGFGGRLMHQQIHCECTQQPKSGTKVRRTIRSEKRGPLLKSRGKGAARQKRKMSALWRTRP